MTRIGLISDTHLFAESKPLPDIIFQTFSDCDFIFHAGDILCESVLQSLERIAPITAVAGNNDPDQLVKKLGFQKEIIIEEYKLLLFHGHEGYGSTIQNVKRIAQKSQADIFIFGHSHEPLYLVENNKHFINPGSAIQRRRQPKCSVAVLKIAETIAETIAVDFNFF